MMISKEEAIDDTYVDEATVDGENFRRVITLQEFNDTIDKIYDSRGTCGECKYWLDRIEYTPCAMSGSAKSAEGFCDEFGRKEDD